ncbi:MAG: hypothetical protein JWR72_2647 [Flavisolibacter sp.]|jgi:hypothetical protein|nr:hypothetical protein [Flavisolibacter sp.]
MAGDNLVKTLIIVSHYFNTNRRLVALNRNYNFVGSQDYTRAMKNRQNEKKEVD